jgi:MOSC domain-containing protein YiiM
VSPWAGSDPDHPKCKLRRVAGAAKRLTGWYYRIIEGGFIERGDELSLIDRLSPDRTIRRFWRALYVDTMNFDELAGIAGLSHLPEKGRAYAWKRRATRQVEDRLRRLNRP